jgi:hypothetical protein
VTMCKGERKESRAKVGYTSNIISDPINEVYLSRSNGIIHI